jgi:hypothetical protein
MQVPAFELPVCTRVTGKPECPRVGRLLPINASALPDARSNALVAIGPQVPDLTAGVNQQTALSFVLAGQQPGRHGFMRSSEMHG